MSVPRLEASCSVDVDVFQSVDEQRLVLFQRQTGELMLLVGRSVELWRALAQGTETAHNAEDRLLLGTWRRRGFVSSRDSL